MTPNQTAQIGMLFIVPGAIIVAVAGLSPLAAGKLMPIPALSMQLLVLIAAFMWILVASRQGALRIHPRTAFLAGIFFALLGFSAIGSVGLHVTLRELANVGAYLLVFLMVSSMPPDKRTIYAILGSLLASSLVEGALAVREYMLAQDPAWRVFSTFFNPDFLAGFMVLMLPVALAWYLSRTSLGISTVAALAVIFIFASIIMTGSRFGAMTAVGGVGVFALLAVVSGSIRKNELIRAAILVIPLILIAISLGRPLAERVGSVHAEAYSGGFRLYTWKGTTEMAAANPINGTGLGTFGLAYPKYAHVDFTWLTHNSYLQVAAEAGPLAAVVLILLLASAAGPPTLSLLRRRRPESPDEPWIPEPRLLLAGLIGGVAASLARNVVDSDWYVTAIGIAFWAILGAAVAMSQGEPMRELRVTSRRRFAAGGLLIVGILGLGSMLVGEMYARAGFAAWQDNPLAALEHYERASKFDPLNANYQRWIAGVSGWLEHHLGEELYADKGEKALLRAIELEPEYAVNYYRLGRAYESWFRREDAVRAYELALEKNPNSPTVMLALAEQYEHLFRDEEAIAVWKRMVEVEESPYGQIRAVPELVEPEYIFAHFALGHHYSHNDDPEQAQSHYRRAFERAERYQNSMESMGAILEISMRRDERMERRVSHVMELLSNQLE